MGNKSSKRRFALSSETRAMLSQVEDKLQERLVLITEMEAVAVGRRKSGDPEYAGGATRVRWVLEFLMKPLAWSSAACPAQARSALAMAVISEWTGCSRKELLRMLRDSKAVVKRDAVVAGVATALRDPAALADAVGPLLVEVMWSTRATTFVSPVDIEAALARVSAAESSYVAQFIRVWFTRAILGHVVGAYTPPAKVTCVPRLGDVLPQFVGSPEEQPLAASRSGPAPASAAAAPAGDGDGDGQTAAWWRTARLNELDAVEAEQRAWRMSQSVSGLSEARTSVWDNMADQWMLIHAVGPRAEVGKHAVWTRTYDSHEHGDTFQELVRALTVNRPALILIGSEEDLVVGGFTGAGIKGLKPTWQGDPSAFIFRLSPDPHVWRTGGRNDHFVYLNADTNMLANGLAFGGQLPPAQTSLREGFHGLWLAQSFDSVHSHGPCSTYSRAPCLHPEGTTSFPPLRVEVWVLAPAGGNPFISPEAEIEAAEAEADTQAVSVLDADRELNVLLDAAGVRQNHSDALR